MLCGMDPTCRSDSVLLLNAVPAARITSRHGLPVNADDFRRRLIARVGRIEVALLHRIAITVITILLDLLLRLAIGWIRNHVVRVAGLLRRLRQGFRAVHGLDTLRWFGDHIFLSALLVGVVGARGEEEQRTA